MHTIEDAKLNAHFAGLQSFAATLSRAQEGVLMALLASMASAMAPAQPPAKPGDLPTDEEKAALEAFRQQHAPKPAEPAPETIGTV